MVPALSHERRVVVLLATLAAGALIGAAGHAITGDQAWFLAVPAGLAAVWMVVADPTRCLPGSAQRDATPAVGGDDEAGPRNIEIKARIDSIEAVARKAAAVATQGPLEIAQDDTFFRCESGRLKLRTFAPTEGELIFYRRADMPGPKESFYVRTPTASPGSLRECLMLAYGEVGRVVKLRTLYLVGRTRVHLDRVQGLGHFLELEVVLQESEPVELGIQEAHWLMAQLGVDSSQLIEDAYVDLLARIAE